MGNMQRLGQIDQVAKRRPHRCLQLKYIQRQTNNPRAQVPRKRDQIHTGAKRLQTKQQASPLRPLFCPLQDLGCHQRRCHPKADRKAALWARSQAQNRSRPPKSRVLTLATVCHRKKLRQEHQRSHEQRRGQRAQKPKRALQIKGQPNKWLSFEMNFRKCLLDYKLCSVVEYQWFPRRGGQAKE